MQKTILDNGVTVVTREFKRAHDVFMKWSLHGGVQAEPEGMHGGIHFIEHLIGDRKKTLYPVSAIGGRINLATGYSGVEMYAHASRQHQATLSRAVLREGLRPADFSNSAFETERGRIMMEIIESATNISDIFGYATYVKMFAGTPRAHPILGTLNDVEAMRLRDLTGFHGELQRGPELIVAAAGPIKHDVVVGDVERATRHFNPQPLPPIKPSYFRPGTLRLEVGNSRSPYESVQFMPIFGLEPSSSPRRTAHVMLSDIIGGASPLSHLHRELSDRRGLVYGISAGPSHWQHDGIMQFFFMTSRQNAEKSLDVFADILSRSPELITATDLQRIKHGHLFQLAASPETPESWAQRAPDNMRDYGRVLSKREIAARYQAVTLRDIRESAELMFSRAPFVTARGPVARLALQQPFTERLGRYRR